MLREGKATWSNDRAIFNFYHVWLGWDCTSFLWWYLWYHIYNQCEMCDVFMNGHFHAIDGLNTRCSASNLITNFKWMLSIFHTLQTLFDFNTNYFKNILLDKSQQKWLFSLRGNLLNFWHCVNIGHAQIYKCERLWKCMWMMRVAL